MHILPHQYDLIKERRETLFRYCESISNEHFTHDNEGFGGRSIQYLFVHVANTYIFWLGHFPSISNLNFAKAENYKSLDDVKTLFKTIDEITAIFLNRFDPVPEYPITNKISGREMELAITPLQLFTHVITHEYHHKGQILSMSRQLGYTPIDTDLIRFD
jgi:uncharacterized damage-inducible protein DinB